MDYCSRIFFYYSEKNGKRSKLKIWISELCVYAEVPMLIRIFILIYWQLAYDWCLRKWSCFYDPWEPKSLNESFLSLYQELIRVVNRVQQQQLSGMWLSYSDLFHNNVVLYLLIIWAVVTQVQETVLINMVFHILPRKSQSYSSKSYPFWYI